MRTAQLTGSWATWQTWRRRLKATAHLPWLLWSTRRADAGPCFCQSEEPTTSHVSVKPTTESNLEPALAVALRKYFRLERRPHSRQQTCGQMCLFDGLVRLPPRQVFLWESRRCGDRKKNTLLIWKRLLANVVCAVTLSVSNFELHRTRKNPPEFVQSPLCYCCCFLHFLTLIWTSSR